MTALPVHAPAARSPIETPYARKVLGRREARRLADLVADAERRARAVFDAANREAEDIFAEARAEANAILALLPNMEELAQTPAKRGRTALSVIREVADRHGLALAVVAGRQTHERARACPKLEPWEIGKLFAGRSGAWVVGILREARGHDGG
ncbi:MAG: hypothetical protein M9944_07940 [Rhizobiaceae bacterium]|nr:hypothetical protein [Rhizobiaceae bacterium]